MLSKLLKITQPIVAGLGNEPMQPFSAEPVFSARRPPYICFSYIKVF